MDDVRIIEIKKSVFEANSKDADNLRQELKKRGTLLINLMSSPGSGKTTTLVNTLNKIKDKYKICVMEADIDGACDTETLLNNKIDAIQLHTGGMCHLDAFMTKQGLDEIINNNYDLIVIENVGNLVCPAEFDTGAHINIAILSIPEGDDKPIKYPLMFEICSLVIINKIDVIDYFDFDLTKAKSNILKRNKNAKIIEISAKKDINCDIFADYIVSEIKKIKGEN